MAKRAREEDLESLDTAFLSTPSPKRRRHVYYRACLLFVLLVFEHAYYRAMLTIETGLQSRGYGISFAERNRYQFLLLKNYLFLLSISFS